MKKITILSLLLAACLHTQAAENASTLYLSHCNGVIASSGVKGTSGSQWNAAATRFSADEVARMMGNDISAARVGLASKLNVQEVTLWVRSSLEGENLASATTTEIAKGWIELPFPIPYHIDQAQELYVGVSYRQKGSSKPVAVIDTERIEGGFYFQPNDGSWSDCSNMGIACIEGCITGNNLPQYDLALTAISTTQNYVMNTDMNIQLQVSNRAAAVVTGFTARVTVDEAEAVETHVTCNLAYRENATLTAVVKPMLSQPRMNANVQVEIVSIDGGEDVNPADNLQQTSVNLLARQFERHLLIEEFTGERCSNCPPAAYMLHQLLDDPAYSSRVSAVCHHIGFYSDWLTTDNASQYLWFFNSTSSYAPAFMWDRSLILQETAPVTTCPSTITDMREIVDARLQQTSLCEVTAQASFDANSKQLNVSVVGQRCAEFCNTPARVTVFVVENNIEAHVQAGATSTPYIHQHVLRGYNATFGTEIEWKEDETFTYDCRIEIRDDWKQADLRIVVFVSGYDAENPANCAIENSCEIAFPGYESAIQCIEATASANDGKELRNGRLTIRHNGNRYLIDN